MKSILVVSLLTMLAAPVHAQDQALAARIRQRHRQFSERES